MFKGNYKNYYDYVKRQTLFDNGVLRIKKNFSNLGIWLVKNSQGRNTLNLGNFRIQF